MPLSKVNSNSIHATKSSEILIWEITESISQLEDIFGNSLSQSSVYKKIKLDKRKKEWLTVRIMLQQYFGKETTISYDTYGAPMVDIENTSIAISHSDNWVALYISKRSSLIGIDIQVLNPKLELIASKFLSKKEFDLWEKYSNQNYIHALWTIKEAVYKAFRHNQDFKKIVVISKYPFENPVIEVEVKRGGKTYILTVKHSECEDYHIATVLL